VDRDNEGILNEDVLATRARQATDEPVIDDLVVLARPSRKAVFVGRFPSSRTSPPRTTHCASEDEIVGNTLLLLAAPTKRQCGSSVTESSPCCSARNSHGLPEDKLQSSVIGAIDPRDTSRPGW
jgi:hypothetical protein